MEPVGAPPRLPRPDRAARRGTRARGAVQRLPHADREVGRGSRARVRPYNRMMRSLLLAACCAACGFSPSSGGVRRPRCAGFDGELDRWQRRESRRDRAGHVLRRWLARAGYHTNGVTRTTTARTSRRCSRNRRPARSSDSSSPTWGSDATNGWPHGLGARRRPTLQHRRRRRDLVAGGHVRRTCSPPTTRASSRSRSTARSRACTPTSPANGTLSLTSAARRLVSDPRRDERVDRQRDVRARSIRQLDDSVGTVPDEPVAREDDRHARARRVSVRARGDRVPRPGVWLDPDRSITISFTPGPSDYPYDGVLGALRRSAADRCGDTSAITVDVGADLDDALPVLDRRAARRESLADARRSDTLGRARRRTGTRSRSTTATTSAARACICDSTARRCPRITCVPPSRGAFPMQVYGNGTAVPWSGTTPAIYTPRRAGGRWRGDRHGRPRLRHRRDAHRTRGDARARWRQRSDHGAYDAERDQYGESPLRLRRATHRVRRHAARRDLAVHGDTERHEWSDDGGGRRVDPRRAEHAVHAGRDVHLAAAETPRRG